MTEDFDALSRVLDARYSCRGFRADPVPEDVIEQIITTAGRAPSWCNAQPWQVTVTRGDETDRFRAALLETVEHEKPAPDQPWPESYPGATGDRRRTCGYQLYEAVGIERKDYDARAAQSERNFDFFDAPHVAIVHTDSALGTYGAVDGGAYLVAFMMAATAQGVATIAQASVAAFPADRLNPDDWPQHEWDWVQWAEFSYPFNFSNQPAASIPCGFTPDGLPVGLQIVGPRFEDLRVLQAAAAFEEARPWADKRPAL